jgi:hypothetical protein
VTSDTLRNIKYTNYYFVNEELIVQRMQYLSMPIPIDCKSITAKISFCGVRTDTLTNILYNFCSLVAATLWH